MVEDVAISAERMRAELHSESERFHKYGHQAHHMQILLTTLIVGSSALAAILGLGFNVDSKIVGGIALIPGMCAGAEDKFRLRSRKNWYYRKYDALVALARQLDFAPKPVTAAQVAKIAEVWTKVELDMSAAYEKFEGEGQAPKGPATNAS